MIYTSPERESQLRFIAAARELERRSRAAPLAFYRPHVGQLRFHKAMASTARIVLCHPGNRFGKTTALAAEIVAHLYGYRPWEVDGIQLTDKGDYPPRNAVPAETWVLRSNGLPIAVPGKFLVVSGLPARQGLLGAVWPKIEGFLPPAVRAHSGFSLRRGAFSVPMELVMPEDLSTGGASISFGSGDQEPTAFAGSHFDGVFCDEPPKRVFWSEIWRGATDRRARVAFSCTPAGRNAPWLHDQFIANPEPGIEVISIAGSIHENPHVGDVEKREFLEGGNFSDDERAAREHGTFEFLSHRAFPTFNTGAHVIPAGSIPSGYIGMACDPAHRRPFYFLWGVFHGGGERVTIIKEWPPGDHARMQTSPYSVRDYAKIIRTIEAELGIVPEFRALDPRFGSAHSHLKGQVHTSIQEDFSAAGLQFECRIEGTEREETGIARIRELLAYDSRSPLSQVNCPRIRIFDNCPNLIRSLTHSNFKPASLDDPDALPEKLKEAWKDARDALRYLLLLPVFQPEQDGPSYISDKDLREFNESLEWY